MSIRRILSGSAIHLGPMETLTLLTGGKASQVRSVRAIYDAGSIACRSCRAERLFASPGIGRTGAISASVIGTREGHRCPPPPPRGLLVRSGPPCSREEAPHEIASCLVRCAIRSTENIWRVGTDTMLRGFRAGRRQAPSPGGVWSV